MLVAAFNLDSRETECAGPLDLNKMLAKFIPNSIVDPFKMSRKLQQPTFMALAGRPSIDSQEGLWSSNQPLMASSEKETQDGNHNVSKRRYRQCSQMLWIHLLLIVLYTLVFLTATGLWNYQHARNIAYCRSILTNSSMSRRLKVNL